MEACGDTCAFRGLVLRSCRCGELDVPRTKEIHLIGGTAGGFEGGFAHGFVAVSAILRRCRRECCCRVVREQGNFSPTPCASDLATTGDERKIRCSGAWLFSARVPLSRLLGVRPDSLRTHHLFLSSLTCFCQFPFHMKELSSKARASHSLTVMVRGGHVFRVAWLSDRRGDEGKS